MSTEDAPTWFIYDDANGGISWCRVDNSVDPLLDLVHARFTAGGHVEPAAVLRWLQGVAPDPWSGAGDGGGDAGVLEALLNKIRSD